MQNILIHNGISIPYTIKSRKGARGIRIAVHADGAVVVTKSPRVSQREIERLVREKAEWIKQKVADILARPQKLLAHYSTKDFKENKERSYVLVHNRALHFNKFYNFEVQNITIRNQKTRWGSCSGKKNLSFNYKVVFLPEELQDYIIVHELCHLKEMNHSTEFWNLVAMQVSDYKIKRQKIKLY